MNGNLVVSVSREYGSGGKAIAVKIAEHFGLPCYDREFVERIAAESGISEEFIHQNYEENSRKKTFFDRMKNGMTAYEGFIDERVYRAQENVIKNIAASESCVIVGRSSNVILYGDPDVVTIFVHAPEAFRAQRILAEARTDDPKQIIETLRYVDRHRARFHDLHSRFKWSDARGYMLCVDSSVLGIDGTAEMLCSYISSCRENMH